MTLSMQPVVFELGILRVGESAQFEFVVHQQDMQQFAALSGDFNPLHLDDDFAQNKGFSGAVVYGGLIVAMVSRMIGMHLPGRDSVWSSLNVEFRQPLYVEQSAVLEATVASVSESTGMIEIKLAVRAGGKLLAKGKAEVLLVSK